MKLFGTNYGGFYYPENLQGLDSSSIIYCFGAGEDISHDILIGNQLKSKVYIFDPTPRSISHVNHVKNVLDGKQTPSYSNKIAGGEPFNYWKLILENSISSDNIIFKEYAIGVNEGVHKFYLPSNEDYVSCSLEKGMKGTKFINVNVRTLKTIMKELNHSKIDLLKMDIEGTECDVIENMINEKIFPRYLAVEFDLAFNGENIKDIERCNFIIEKLIQNNYELIHRNNSDFTFRLKTKNITDLEKKKINHKKILFLLDKPGPPTKARYQHTLITIAEGLEKLNIDYNSNINYYKKSNGDYLFNQTKDINYDNYDYIITSHCSHDFGNIDYIQEFLSRKNTKYKLIMIDWFDGFFELNQYLKYYDYWFKINYETNILKNFSSKLHPSIICSTNRIIESTQTNIKWEERNINLFYSHRIPHGNREYILNIYKKLFEDITFFNDNFSEPTESDDYYIDWCQTGRRHNPKYYEILKNTKIMDCTAGFLEKINNQEVIIQNDSWKLWEAFFAGCCVLTIDLDLYNIQFPIQPKNMIHYIGITLNEEEDIKIIKNILNGNIDIKKIAENGHNFVKENYTPEQFTKYILETINYI